MLGVVSAVIVTALAYIAFRGVSPNTDPVLSQNFAHHDGAVSTADTGQKWITSTNGAPNADLRVIDGRLTNTAQGDGTAAGSISADLPNAVSKITATFGFQRGATDYGSVAIVVQTDAPPGDSSANQHVTSPCHIVITSTKIDFGVANNGRIAQVGTGTFAERLTDAATYQVSVEINYDKGVVRIDGPDGVTRVYADSRITTNRGSIVSYDVYQQTAATDDRPYFTELQAW